MGGNPFNELNPGDFQSSVTESQALNLEPGLIVSIEFQVIRTKPGTLTGDCQCHRRTWSKIWSYKTRFRMSLLESCLLRLGTSALKITVIQFESLT